jgi:hypothetical protein
MSDLHLSASRALILLLRENGILMSARNSFLYQVIADAVVDASKDCLPPLNPAPAMALDQFRPGELAVSVRACQNHARLYGEACWRSAGSAEGMERAG